MDRFEEATRKRFRFADKCVGMNVEDLWSLPLQSAKNDSLDGVAKNLRRKIRESEEESFVDTTPGTTELNKKFELVLHIIEVRKQELEKAKEDRINMERREKIKSILAEKDDEDLKSKSKEELLRELNG